MKVSLQKFSKGAFRISEWWVVEAIRKGLMYSMPLILIGSLTTLLINLPIDFFQTFMENLMGVHWKDIFLYMNNGTFGIMSIGVLVTTTYAILIKNPILQSDDVSFPITIVIVLGSYFTFMSDSEIVIDKPMASSIGLFIAIVFSVTVTTLLLYLSKNNPLKNKIYMYDADNTLMDTINILVPAMITFMLVAIFKKIFVVTELCNLNLNPFIRFLERIPEVLGAIIFQALTSILWFFGIHGNNILEPVTETFLKVSSIENMNMVAAGLGPKNILTKQFLDQFIYLGGSGATLCLIAALLISGKKSNDNKIAKLSLMPGIFNINELITFGLPLVLNPYFLIPFLLVPMVLVIVTYLSMYLGIVPLTINSNIEWTTPIILGGYLSTGSIRGSILQVVNLIIGTIIYIPFVKMHQAYKVERNKEELFKLTDMIVGDEIKSSAELMSREDLIGDLSRNIAEDINRFLTDDKGYLEIHMECQPQVDYNGKIVGAESLLRANHSQLGYIPPPVIMTIADGAGLTDKIGDYIISKSLDNYCKWKEYASDDIAISINLSMEQMKSPNFIPNLRRTLEEKGIDDCTKIEFELLETTAFAQTETTMKKLNELQNMGIKLSIDDFGMGYGSMLYIKSFPIEKIKLDRSLVYDITSSKDSQEIIISIINLCNSFNIKVLAEFVETEEQMEKLYELGCSLYQGYLFSPSLKVDDFIEYVKDNKKESLND